MKNLKRLRNEIEKKYEKDKVWFFPRSKDVNSKNSKPEYVKRVKQTNVKGYLGEKVMFVAEIPINRNGKKGGDFPSSNDVFLYEMLNKECKGFFRDAHLTDLIKLVKTGNEAKEFFKNKENNLEYKEQINYFKKECEIIKPKIIVAMSRRVEKLLKKEGFESSEYIWHYSYKRKGLNKREKHWREKLRWIKENYKELKNKN